MRKFLISIITLTSLFGLAACNSDVIVQTEVGNITKDDFYEELQMNYGESTLQNMIFVKVLEDKYEVSEEDIDNRIDLLKDELGNQFQMFLMQQGFENEDDDLFRTSVHNLVLQEKLQFEGIEVSDEEINDKYDEMLDNHEIEIKASHILFDADDEDTAKDVLKKIDEGEEFAELAKEYSEDNSAENGGDLGYFKTGQMVPEFEDAAYSLKEGEVSDLVESEHGIHIIKVTDIPSVDDKTEHIRYTLMSEKVNPEEVDKRVEQLLKDANVDIKIKDYEALEQYFNTEDPIDDEETEDIDQNDDSQNDNDQNNNDQNDNSSENNEENSNTENNE